MNASVSYLQLTDRGLLEVAGADRVAFLQGLVSADVTQATPVRALWAALLTPQGKYLFDFFILAEGERLLLDGEVGRLEALRSRLLPYRLRSKVTLTLRPELQVWALSHQLPGAVPDPRHAEMGWRLISAAAPPEAIPGDSTAYERRRFALGVPDGSRDLEIEKALLLENGFDELGGISWTKGCWMGQELTARTKYRALIKRRLLPVELESEAPPPGTPIYADTRAVGEIRSSQGRQALALLRLDALDQPLSTEGGRVTLQPPAWIKLPAQP